MNISIKIFLFLELLLLALFGLAYWGSKTESVRNEFGGGLLDLLVVFTGLMLFLVAIMGIRERHKYTMARSLGKTIRALKKH